MNMKKIYNPPSSEIISLISSDVITTSLTREERGIGDIVDCFTGWIPSN